MISQKIVAGEREMLAQIYLKRGALVPMHAHESEQMTYILQGSLRFLVGGEEIIVREGEVLHIPSNVPHKAEALEDTLDVDIFEQEGMQHLVVRDHGRGIETDDQDRIFEIFQSVGKRADGRVGTGMGLAIVKKIVEIGAFVEIIPGTDGLLHISKLGRGRRLAKVEAGMQRADE